MTSSFLSGDADLHALFKLIQRPESELTRVDFQEQLLLASVRAATRIWKQGDTVLGFAFVDAYNNLWFETESDFFLRNELETEMVEWGVACMQRRNAATNSKNTLDCCCRVDNLDRIRVLEKHGFVLEPIRSLRYARSLDTPMPTYPLPDGFSLRSVAGKDKVEQLVALHRAAFGTDSMNVEQRLAMMCTP